MATYKGKISDPDWHPEIDMLLNFSEGLLPDEVNDQLNSHIENCQTCRRTILGLEATLSLGANHGELKIEANKRADKAYQKFVQDKKLINTSSKSRKIVTFISIPTLAAASIALFFFLRGFQVSFLPGDIPQVDYDNIERTVSSDFEQGIVKYNEEQYNMARSLLLSADTIASAYYLGLIELREGNNGLEKAEKYFEKIHASASGKIRGNATFYLAQIAYKKKDYEKSRMMIIELKNDPSLFYDKNIQKIHTQLKD